MSEDHGTNDRPDVGGIVPAGSPVTTFYFGGKPIRVALVDDEPWYVAADAASALEYAGGARNAIARIPGHLKGVAPINTPGGTQRMVVLAEAGLNLLIIHAETAAAERFKLWLAAEVIPTIRRTGRYELPSNPPLPAVPGVDLAAMEQMLADGPTVLMLLSKTSERLALTMAENHRLTVEVEVMKPKAMLADRLLTAEGDMSVRDAAQALATDYGIDIGQNRLFDYLREIKWIDTKRRAFQKHIDAGRLRMRPMTFENRKTSVREVATPQVRVTAKGFGELHAKLTASDQLELTY